MREKVLVEYPIVGIVIAIVQGYLQHVEVP